MADLIYETPRRRQQPGVTAKARAKRKRADGSVAKAVRAACVERDGYCRVCDWEDNPDDWHSDDLEPGDEFACQNPSEWCHMHARRRSQTRNQAPEKRHDTAHSFMACRTHHDQYDGRQTPRLFVTALTSKGADGPLKFRMGR